MAKPRRTAQADIPRTPLPSFGGLPSKRHSVLLKQMAAIAIVPADSTADAKQGIAALRQRGIFDTVSFSLPGRLDPSDAACLPMKSPALWVRPPGRGWPRVNKALGIRIATIRSPDGAMPVAVRTHYGNTEGAFTEIQFSLPRLLVDHNDDITVGANTDLPALIVEIARIYCSETIRRNLRGVDLEDLVMPSDIPGLAVTRLDLTGDLDTDANAAIEAVRSSHWLRSRRPASETANYPSVLFRKGKSGTEGYEEVEMYDEGERQIDKPNDESPVQYPPGMRLRIEMRAKHSGPLSRMAEAVTVMSSSRNEPTIPVWSAGNRSEPKTIPLPLDLPALHAYFAMTVSGLCRSAGKVSRHILDSVEAVALEALAHPDGWALLARFKRDMAQDPKRRAQYNRIAAKVEVMRRRFHYPVLLPILYPPPELHALDGMRARLLQAIDGV
jgi:hypothetical protein